MSSFAQGGSDLTGASANLVNKDNPVQHQSRDLDSEKGHKATLTENGWRTEVMSKDRTDVAQATPMHTNVFSDIRSKAGGQPQTIFDAQPDSIVTVPGVGSMTMQSAITAGFATKNADGTITHGPAHPNKHGPRPGVDDGSADSGEGYDAADDGEGESDHPDLQTDAMDEASEAELTALAESTQPGTQLHAVEEFASTGEISASTINTLATQAGVEPSVMAEQIASVQGKLEDQARAAVRDFGGAGNEDGIIEYGWEHEPELMAAAVKRHMTLRQTGGYEAIAARYWQTADQHSPESILSADWGEFKARQDSSTGKIILEGGGKSVEWRTFISTVMRLDRKASR